MHKKNSAENKVNNKAHAVFLTSVSTFNCSNLKLNLCLRWREKATPYNSQPSRLQNSRHVYKRTVTSTKQPSHLQNNRHAYNSQPSRLQFTAVTSTKEPSRLQNNRHAYNSQPSRLQFTTCFVDVTVANCRLDG